MTEASHQMASNPLPPRAAQARHGRHRRRAGGRDHGRRRQAARAATIGEIVIRGDERDRRLREQPEGQRRGLHQRLVPHRRPGHAGRRRLSQPHRPAEGDHQPRRREDLAARGGRGADGPSGGGAGRHLRRAARQAGRGRRRRGGAARRRERRARRNCATSRPTRLADFKVPRKILFLAEIPKGATGKLQRIGLAQSWGCGVSTCEPTINPPPPRWGRAGVGVALSGEDCAKLNQRPHPNPPPAGVGGDAERA